ncbi:N-acetylneuraminate synthase family protein [Silvanigrella aquatica]|uniref:Acetylneuraminic acid synthetase n=1 Tax=Silvanigrella aquatica TaxID=1915309 RepID=A0A1L4D2Z6_9BACT|nr:N-acetylneuraminate synthase family protein [Silvanigrella aquatica]APJ04569.1 acetylneuraminic acid synthetase [Silvanigrella aquatica]
MKIGNWDSSKSKNPYLIAEVGVNHECNMDIAKKQVRLAKDGGANAIKFQTYKAEKLACKNSPSYWNTAEETISNQFDLFKKYDSFGEEQYIEIANYCREIGIDFMSTPFDLEAVDWIDPYVPVFKIASADITNVPLLQKIASKNKPIILSTGASNLPEIEYALNILEENGAKSVAILHCVLSYPCNFEAANLNVIPYLKKVFPKHVVGYSDHTKPDNQMLVITSAWLLGSLIIEKHFTHDKTLPGNDHYHSMDVNDLKIFKNNIEFISSLLGNNSKNVADEEKEARKFARRSIVSAHFIPKGKIIQMEDLICKRPGTGLPPNNINDLIGKMAVRDIHDDHMISALDLN